MPMPDGVMVEVEVDGEWWYMCQTMGELDITHDPRRALKMVHADLTMKVVEYLGERLVKRGRGSVTRTRMVAV